MANGVFRLYPDWFEKVWTVKNHKKCNICKSEPNHIGSALKRDSTSDTSDSLQMPLSPDAPTVWISKCLLMHWQWDSCQIQFDSSYLSPSIIQRLIQIGWWYLGTQIHSNHRSQCGRSSTSVLRSKSDKSLKALLLHMERGISVSDDVTVTGCPHISEYFTMSWWFMYLLMMYFLRKMQNQACCKVLSLCRGKATLVSPKVSPQTVLPFLKFLPCVLWSSHLSCWLHCPPRFWRYCSILSIFRQNAECCC